MVVRELNLVPSSLLATMANPNVPDPLNGVPRLYVNKPFGRLPVVALSFAPTEGRVFQVVDSVHVLLVAYTAVDAPTSTTLTRSLTSVT